MKKLLLPAMALLLYACGGGEHKPAEDSKPAGTETTQGTEASGAEQQNAASGDANSKGYGKFQNVELSPKLDATMASNGKKVYDMKCASCHRTDDKKLVGPGWKGVTDRRTPEWIMNFVTNVDENLNKDPQAMSMLEECLVRMPNQNLSDADARNILEFMRQNDGVK